MSTDGPQPTQGAPKKKKEGKSVGCFLPGFWIVFLFLVFFFFCFGGPLLSYCHWHWHRVSFSFGFDVHLGGPAVPATTTATRDPPPTSSQQRHPSATAAALSAFLKTQKRTPRLPERASGIARRFGAHTPPLPARL
jgi:hypothetical protein